MNFYHSKLNAIKIALGMDVKMVDAVLKDGVTKVMAETLEPGSKIYVISESGEKAPAPLNEYTLKEPIWPFLAVVCSPWVGSTNVNCAKYTNIA